MTETLIVGDFFPVKTQAELESEGINYWEQRIVTPLGAFLYDRENEWRDNHSRWVSEDGKIKVTTHDTDNKITSVTGLELV